MILVAFAALRGYEPILSCCCLLQPGTWGAILALILATVGEKSSGLAVALAVCAAACNLVVCSLALAVSHEEKVPGYVFYAGFFLLLCIATFIITYRRSSREQQGGPAPKWPERAVVQEKWQPDKQAGLPGEQFKSSEPPGDLT
jgi:hypothetical protein